MAVISAEKIVALAQVSDGGPEAIKNALIKEVGDILPVVEGLNLYVAMYVGPETRKSGLLRAPETIKEDELQGSLGLVLRLGDGFRDENDVMDAQAEKRYLHQWVKFGYNDGLREHYNGVACRYVDVGRIRGIYPDPTKVL